LYRQRVEIERELRRVPADDNLREKVGSDRPPVAPRERTHLPHVPRSGRDDVQAPEPSWRRQVPAADVGDRASAAMRRSSPLLPPMPAARPSHWRTPQEVQPPPTPPRPSAQQAPRSSAPTPSPIDGAPRPAHHGGRAPSPLRAVSTPPSHREPMRRAHPAAELEALAREMRQKHEAHRRRAREAMRSEKTARQPSSEAAMDHGAGAEDPFQRRASELQRRAVEERRQREEQEGWERDFRSRLQEEEEQRRIASEQARRQRERERAAMAADPGLEDDRRQRRRERRRRRKAEESAAATREAELETERLRRRAQEEEEEEQQQRAREEEAEREADCARRPAPQQAPPPEQPGQQSPSPPPPQRRGKSRSRPRDTGDRSPTRGDSSLRRQASRAAPLQLAQAGAAAMARLQEIAEIPSKGARKKAFKELLRAWHPDKNPSNVEVATAVFQRIQDERSKVLGQ